MKPRRRGHGIQLPSGPSIRSPVVGSRDGRTRSQGGAHPIARSISRAEGQTNGASGSPKNREVRRWNGGWRLRAAATRETRPKEGVSRRRAPPRATSELGAQTVREVRRRNLLSPTRRAGPPSYEDQSLPESSAA